MAKNKYIIITLAIVIIALGVGLYYRNHRDQQKASTTSTNATAQDNYKSGAYRQSGQGTNPSNGGAVDTGGVDAPKTSTGISSASGLITVTSPSRSQVLKPGDVIGGTTSGVDKVQYRLIDDSLGVIAQGELGVVNGSFSGKLQYASKSKTGRLDVFSYDAMSDEKNNIEIAVGFGE